MWAFVALFVAVLLQCSNQVGAGGAPVSQPPWCPVTYSFVVGAPRVSSYPCNCSTPNGIAEGLPRRAAGYNLTNCQNRLSANGLSLSNITNGDSQYTNILYLEGNGLTSILAGDLVPFRGLQYLNLRRNSISHIDPGAFSGLAQLKYLYLSDNQLTAISSTIFTGLGGLQRLFLSNNRISSLPNKVFSAMSQLRDLWLDSNSISSIAARSLEGISGLRLLNLKRNNLTGAFDLGTFNATQSLNSLHLSYNRISSFTGLLVVPGSIPTLSIENNTLTSLPLSLTSIPGDGNVMLAGNPWSCLCTPEFLGLHFVINMFGAASDCFTPPALQYQSIQSLNVPQSQSCACSANCTGQYSAGCNPVNSMCACRSSAMSGARCDECADGRYNFTAGCLPCGCDPPATSGVCDKVTGQCACNSAKTGRTGRTCGSCLALHYEDASGQCRACSCDATGTANCTGLALRVTCECKQGFMGPMCRSCKQGYRAQFGDPVLIGCMTCGCDARGSTGVGCDRNGQCTCRTGTTGLMCDQCLAGYFPQAAATVSPVLVPPTSPSNQIVQGQTCQRKTMLYLCQQCCCNQLSAQNSSCSAVGQCYCHAGYAGLTCDECAPLYTAVFSARGSLCVLTSQLVGRVCQSEFDTLLLVTWPRTRAGVQVTLLCGDGYTGNLTRACNQFGTWERPVLDACVSTMFAALNQQLTALTSSSLSVSPETRHRQALSALSSFANATASGSTSAVSYLVPGDINITTTSLTVLANQIYFASQNDTQDTYTNDYLRTVSNLLEDRNLESWRATENVNTSTTTLLLATSNFAYQTAIATANSSATQDNVVVRQNAALKISVQSTSQPQDIVFPDYSDPVFDKFNPGSSRRLSNIRVPAAAIGKLGAKARTNQLPVANVIFNNLNNIFPSTLDQGSALDSSSTSYELNSVLITTRIGVLDLETNGFENDPITIQLHHANKSIVMRPQCVFWNFSAPGSSGSLGAWDSSGLTRVSTDDATTGVTTCQSTHLTSFAVLVAPTANRAQSTALSYITYIGCAISLGCLAAMVVVLTTLLKGAKPTPRNQQSVIHLNLALSLAFGQITFIAGIQQTDHRVGCGIVAGLLHYFFTVAFAWMAVEGYHLYLMTVHVFKARENRVKKYLLLAWGLPLIVVGVAAGVRYYDYGTPTFCWLSLSNGTIWAFLGPVCFIILVNIFIFINTLRVLVSRTKEGEHTKAVKSGLRATLMLLPLLGLTWIFGLFAVDDNTIVFAYLFTIFNSLQGFFLFLIHVVLNSSIRESYGSAVRRSSLFTLTKTTSLSAEKRTPNSGTSKSNLMYTSNTNQGHSSSSLGVSRSEGGELVRSTDVDAK